MKYLFILMCSVFLSHAQNNEYKKLKDKALVKELFSRDKKITKLENKVKILEAKNKSLSSKQNDLTNVISDVNTVFLNNIYNKKIKKKGNAYFTETKLDDRSLKALDNSNVLLSNILNDEKISDTEKKAVEKLIQFNTNHKKLIGLNTDIEKILTLKVDTVTIVTTLKRLDSLQFTSESKLFAVQKKHNDLLNNYKVSSCNLKAKLDIFTKNKIVSPRTKKSYNDLKSKYTDYAYLVSVVENAESKPDGYIKNSDNLLPYCSVAPVIKVPKKTTETKNDLKDKKMGKEKKATEKVTAKANSKATESTETNKKQKK